MQSLTPSFVLSWYLCISLFLYLYICHFCHLGCCTCRDYLIMQLLYNFCSSDSWSGNRVLSGSSFLHHHWIYSLRRFSSHQVLHWRCKTIHSVSFIIKQTMNSISFTACCKLVRSSQHPIYCVTHYRMIHVLETRKLELEIYTRTHALTKKKRKNLFHQFPVCLFLLT